MNYYLNAIKEYASFSGRTSRKQYWMFFLINLFIFIGIVLLEIGIAELNLGFSTIIPMEKGGQGVINAIYMLFMLIPFFSIAVRRLHDVGKSGWFLLIPIYNFILICGEGTLGENKYGIDPKNKFDS